MNEKREFRPATAKDIIDEYARSGLDINPAAMGGFYGDIKDAISKAEMLYIAALEKIHEISDRNGNLERTLSKESITNTDLHKENVALKERVDELERRNDTLFQKVKALHAEREQSFAYRLAKYLKE